jgi:hypothetical protein
MPPSAESGRAGLWTAGKTYVGLNPNQVVMGARWHGSDGLRSVVDVIRSDHSGKRSYSPTLNTRGILLAV